jgi:hypothetical protein
VVRAAQEVLVKLRLLAVSFALGLSCVAASASAQISDEMPPDTGYISPERMIAEFRVGPYQPDMGGNDAFKTFFGDDLGPLLELELDVIAFRIKDVLYLSGGGTIGTANFHGKTVVSPNGMDTSEETTLALLPLNLLAALRVDILARKLSVPFIVTGKLGYQWMHWDTDSGGADDVSGWSVGYIWAAQFALDLDTFDRHAARAMDEEWGINHSFVFFELNGFVTSDASLPIGDHTWTAGLGFVF